MRNVSRICVLTLAAGVALTACSGQSSATGNGAPAESGPAMTRDYALRDFDGVSVSGSDDVRVSTGKDFSVRAVGPRDTLDKLELTVEDGSLRIGTKSHSGWNWGSRKSATVHVTLPELHSAALAGSGSITVDRAHRGFHGSISGSGDIAVGMIDGGDVALSTTGSGTLSAAGNADSLTISIQGSGDVDARELKARTASVSIAGSGDATATVDGPASVSIMGSGDADLGPDARCHTSRMGSGEAHCGG